MTDFKFIRVEDSGGFGNACCPHCGSEGRYIYVWEEDGKKRAAMAGCYKKLTGHIAKDDLSSYMQLLSEKQVKGKKLNGWDKTVLRMLKFIEDGKYSEQWCRSKIRQTLSDRKRYLAKRGY